VYEIIGYGYEVIFIYLFCIFFQSHLIHGFSLFGSLINLVLICFMLLLVSSLDFEFDKLLGLLLDLGIKTKETF
jgi:hypothetical protein